LKTILRLAFLFLLAALAGCASDNPDTQNHVSTIPWNRPEKWEGTGALGGLTPSTQ
jgi:hypothetical protein